MAEKKLNARLYEERPQRSGTFVLDKHYFQTQAHEALKTFVAPLSGVYEAAFGRKLSAQDHPRPEKKRA